MENTSTPIIGKLELDDEVWQRRQILVHAPLKHMINFTTSFRYMEFTFNKRPIIW
jgi:hypothetical protein